MGRSLPSISTLQDLQFLIISQHHNVELLGNSTSLPDEIWGLRQLKYLRIKGHDLPDPKRSEALLNLSTLYVNSRSCTKAVFKSIPYLKKLVIEIKLQPDANETGMSCFKHVGLLKNFELFKCAVVNPWKRSRVVPPPHHLLNLPAGLTKLSLKGLGYSWKYTRAFSLLRKLRVLKLLCSAFQGPKWNILGWNLSNLKFLLLEDVDVVDWKIDKDHCFTNLRCLKIRHCFKLKKIPQPIGSPYSLKMTEIVDCSPSLVASVLRMWDEGRSLEVDISSSWKL